LISIVASKLENADRRTRGRRDVKGEFNGARLLSLLLGVDGCEVEPRVSSSSARSRSFSLLTRS
jgi:hypothetical protein